MSSATGRISSVVAALALAMAAAACTSDDTLTNVAHTPQFDAVHTPVAFTIGRLKLTGMQQLFPDDRWHLRDIKLSGPVAGDLAGTATMVLNANLDQLLGSGPEWGTLTITTTSGDVWEGNVTGHFLSGLPKPGIQLFAHVHLRGPGTQVLHADCNETTALSELLVCTGEIR